jgi:hypothetical protein
MRRFLGQSHTLYQIATVTGLFSMAPSLPFSHTSAFRLSPRRFEPRMERRIPQLSKKALQEERELWKRSEFRRSRQTSMTTRS